VYLADLLTASQLFFFSKYRPSDRAAIIVGSKWVFYVKKYAGGHVSGDKV
jgi:hypothetical protein